MCGSDGVLHCNLMWRMCALVGLGTYDAKKARDLGIPSILRDKPAEEAVKSRRVTAVEADCCGGLREGGF